MIPSCWRNPANALWLYLPRPSNTKIVNILFCDVWHLSQYSEYRTWNCRIISEWWVGRKWWLNLRLYPGIFIAGLRKIMKSLRLAFMQVFCRQCILEIRIYILFLPEGIILKRICCTKNVYLNICDVQIMSVPGSWTCERYQMCLRWSESLAFAVVYIG
jgi:hypothetical protein